MDIVGIIVQLIAGAVGGLGTGKAVKSVDLGNVGNLIAGAIGGVGGTQLAALIPALSGMLTGAGSGDMGALVGQGVGGLVGGGLLTAIVGAIKNAMARRA